ncbi:hypothetical protein RP20_CCG015457 [Aedes albopictus]|nr:hypothetical protein RP20_CCG015457 [Aedes albopictus]
MLKESCTGTPVTVRVDAKGFYLYWVDQNHEMYFLDIATIRDVRTGPYAKKPRVRKSQTWQHQYSKLSALTIERSNKAIGRRQKIAIRLLLSHRVSRRMIHHHQEVQLLKPSSTGLVISIVGVSLWNPRKTAATKHDRRDRHLAQTNDQRSTYKRLSTEGLLYRSPHAHVTSRYDRIVSPFTDLARTSTAQRNRSLSSSLSEQ